MNARPEIAIGAKLPEISLEATFSRVAMVSPASWDYFPGHHDPYYAQMQGKRSIYLNTMSIGAFLDRVATDWLGADWFIRRRVMRMLQSVCAGDEFKADGIVTELDRRDGNIHAVTIDVTGRTQDGICATSQVRLLAPGA